MSACKGGTGCTAKTERVVEIKEERNLNRVRNTQYNKPIVLFFYSSRDGESVQLKEILSAYFVGEEGVPAVEAVLCVIDTDTAPAAGLLSKAFKVDTIPGATIIDSTKKVLRAISAEELDPVSLQSIVEEQAAKFKQEYEQQRTYYYEKINKALAFSAVVVFIKGTPQNPECGFSEQLLEVLHKQGIKYSSVNVTGEGEESSLRNWVKEYSGWPTIPQVFIKGKIVGGLDKLREIVISGEIKGLVPEEAWVSNDQGQLMESPAVKEILDQDGLLFLCTSDFEGEESRAEVCGQSRFSLLSQGLKELKTVDLSKKKELERELSKILQSGSQDSLDLPVLVHKRKLIRAGNALVNSSVNDLGLDPSFLRGPIEKVLEGLINSSPLMIFIKGTPTNPQCGFTNQLLKILTSLNLKFGHFNILEDPMVREGLKTYSNWKTYPQVYLKGELLGGLDIVKELIEEGEFQTMTAELKLA